MRSTSTTFREALFASQTSEAFLMLVTIEHDDLSDPIRLSSNVADTVSNGETFIAYPFNISLPDDPQTGLTKGKFTFENASPSYIEAIRSITTAPTMQIDIVLASDPDTLEATYACFEMSNFEYDINTITANLSIESFMSEPWPGDSFLPSKFPAVF